MPAKKKTAAKKNTKIAKAKAEKPAPSEAMIDRAVDLVDEANEMICALDDACSADTLDEYHAAIAEASRNLARVMRGMAALAGKLDPEAFAAAEAKSKALPASKAPALMQ